MPITAAVQPNQTQGLYPVLFRTKHTGQYTCYAPVVSTKLSQACGSTALC